MGRPKGSKNKEKPAGVPVPAPATPKASASSDDVVINRDIRLSNKANELLESYNVSVRQEKTKHKSDIIFDLSAQAAFDIITNTSKSTFSDSTNREYEETLKSDHDSGFRGGTQREVVDAGHGKFDKKAFEKKRDEMKKEFSKLDFLEQEIARKRSRVMSEYDGELDFDRLYERAPFYATRVSNNGSARTINLTIDFSFSAGVDADKINKYGATCWSIVDLLERSGIQCNVIIQNKVQRLASKGGQSKVEAPTNWIFNTTVKGANEYIDTVDIARCFNTNFYRRAMFHAWVVGCDALGFQANYGLGSVEQMRSSHASKGEIYLSAEQLMYKDINMNQIETFIREAL